MLAACSEPWAESLGVVSCPGTVVQVPAPAGWTMEPSEVGQVLTAVLLLFAAAAAVRLVLRLVVASSANRG